MKSLSNLDELTENSHHYPPLMTWSYFVSTSW